ncbi:Vacuolar import/degradation Vid27, C-terminal [Dillenia turbinata]|uniref:Vacuolar import/degradation Vid27, C-terminal n=1 Tax=Dillenia turbinata TaxID=194707 RepID=A0AAN8YX96_9MAGN
MGGSQSREGLEISDSEGEEEEYEEVEEQESEKQQNQASNSKTPSGLDEVDERLKTLKLKYPSSSSSSSTPQNPNLKNACKLYLHIGGNTPKAKWILSEKLTFYEFVNGDPEENEESDEDYMWILKVSAKIRVRVSTELQMKMFGDQRRVDFVSGGVWAMKFLNDEEYRNFVTRYHDCLFENVYKVRATEENKVKVYGKEFIGWMKPEAADDSMWEDAPEQPPQETTPVRGSQHLLEEFEEAATDGGIQSLALGALDNSFLVGDSGVQVVKNFSHGIHGKGVYVKFDGGKRRSVRAMREKPRATGLHQLDIETGKIVTEWTFEKDGTEITMRDITNDTKGSQLDPSESTFLGLDDNRLCQWDMRDRRGIVQNIATSTRLSCIGRKGINSRGELIFSALQPLEMVLLLLAPWMEK